MPTVALLKITLQGRQEIAYFDFAPRVPELTDEQRVMRVLRNYDEYRYELFDIPRQVAVTTVSTLLCEAQPKDPLLATYVRASGDLGTDEALHCAARYRDHADPRVRLAVIRMFGQVMAIDYVPWLGDWATHDDVEFRRQAVVALGKIPHASVPPQLDRFIPGADAQLLSLIELGKQKIACFIDHPSEASIHHRARLELASDEYEDLVSRVAYVAKPLDDVVKDAEAPVTLRTRALRVLGLGRLPAIAMTYFWVLGQKDGLPEEMRLEAIVALGLLRMRGADEALLEQIHTAEPSLRHAAINALARTGKASTLEALLAAWDFENGALRPTIAAAARELAKFDGAPLLESALDQKRAAPSDALFFIDATTLARGLPVEEVKQLMHSEVPEARRDAALLFVYFGPPQEAHVLRNLAEREREPNIKRIAERGFARLDGIARLAGNP